MHVKDFTDSQVEDFIVAVNITVHPNKRDTLIGRQRRAVLKFFQSKQNLYKHNLAIRWLANNKISVLKLEWDT